MPEDIDEGVAYLRALKQSAVQTSGAATAPAPEARASHQVTTAANAADQFSGAEKRRSPRYRCEGSAEVREEGCDVRTWATFTDVSLHGCYVEAQATYPTGTKLHLKLEANGERVEAKGTVAVNYPYLGMGIAFEEMADSDKAHLKRLLATLGHHCLVMGPGIASSLPANGPLEALPLISDPGAAIQGLVEFFETRQILMREDFLRILKKSQKK
ncbi:MAG: PilZ domain-containing protein [Candidatus Sulfotelmatobacter sp.]